MAVGQRPRHDGPEAFEVVARRIRARAARMLAELPVEDPAVVWARRATLMAEMQGVGVSELKLRTTGPAGVWRWEPATDPGDVGSVR